MYPFDRICPDIGCEVLKNLIIHLFLQLQQRFFDKCLLIRKKKLLLP